ncbi:MAG: glycosyltransferase 87 family protein [Vicinamibacterales bacterium]
MRAPHLLIAVLAVHVVAFALAAAQSGRPAGDFDRYYEIGSAPGRPYLDYQVEHPIGTLLVFRSLAHLTGGRPSFGLGVVVLDLIADVIIVGSLLWEWGVPAATVGAAALVPVLGLFFNRIDAWSTAAAVVAVAAWRRKRPVALGCALTIGAAFKLWPLVLAPLLIVPWRGRRSLPGIAAFATTALAFAGAALWMAGSRGIVQVLTFRGATGWQIESLVGSLVHLADSRTLRMESGSWRIGATSGPVAVAMFLAAAPICVWSSWRGARINRLGAGWLASVASLLLLSALLSAQFVIWLAPAAAMAWTEGDTRLAWMAAIAIALTQLLWSGYGSVLSGEMPALLVVVLRNVVLLVLAGCALARLSARRPASTP